MTTNYAHGGWSSGLTPHGSIHIYDKHGSQIAFVVGRKAQEANGRLIAAAPELLEAARVAEALIGKLEPGHPGAVEAYQHLGLAIAKAKGEQPRHNAGLPRAASWPMSPAEYLARRLREDDEDLQDLMDRDMGD